VYEFFRKFETTLSRMVYLSEPSGCFIQNSLHLPFSRRMDAILAELRALRAIITGLHPCSDPTPLCEGVTGKGTPCRNRAVPCTGYCRMHGERPPKEVKPVRVKKAKKPKKIQPEHTHGIDEVGLGCPLCDTHGNVWDPGLTECCFVGDDNSLES